MKLRFKPVRFLLIALGVVLCALAANVCLYFFYPDVGRLKKENPRKTSFMEYREQEWLEQGKKKKIQQRWVPLSGISPYLVKAVLISEDDKFWNHEGFDFEAMKAALEKDLKKKKFKYGGSTISQQLAKNLYLTPSRNPVRKIKEAVLTWRLEKALSKRRIIELYLNVAEWGDGIFGIGAAARHYYGKSAAALDPMESAKLASVLPNPRKYKVNRNSGYVENRADRIYSIMVRRGIVIPEYEEVISAADEETAPVIAAAPEKDSPAKP
ncbi:MAG: monofunctional biosynthetic peptidoglycan transglycosylase [Syntrophaceae bacterium]